MNPLVQKFLNGQLPEPLAVNLLSGLLPIPAPDLLQALAFAVARQSPLAPKALETFLAMPSAPIQTTLEQSIQPPTPLALILAYRKEPEILETALLHTDLTPELLEWAVPYLPGTHLDMVANNQRLWVAHPAILDRLEAHPECDYNTRRRCAEFRRDVLKTVSTEEATEKIEILNEVASGSLDPAWAALPPPEAEEPTPETQPSAPAGAPVVPEAALPAAPETGGSAFIEEPILDHEGKPVRISVTQRCMKLKTNQKILLASTGGKEERTILIRESNRLIQAAVMKNPRLSDAEVTYIAQMRTVNEEVFRIIAMNREWMKVYQIYKNLVLNPRVPLHISMTNLKRLQEADIKLIMKDKNVSEIIRREAKRMIEAKNQKPNAH